MPAVLSLVSVPMIRLALTLMHVAGLATNKGLVGLYFAAPPFPPDFMRAVLHGQPDAMQHGPRRLLSNAKGASQLARRDAVLSKGNEPHGRKPLVQAKRRMLEDGANLDRELFPRVLMPAFPGAASRNELHFLTPQVGQITPFGQRSAAKNLMQVSTSAKYMIAF